MILRIAFPFFLFLLVTSSNIKAQFSRGDVILDGSLQLLKTKSETLNFINFGSGIEVVGPYDYELLDLTFSPSLEFFIDENLAVAAGLLLNVRNSTQASEIDYIDYTISLNPGIKYYYSITEKIFFYNAFYSAFGIGGSSQDYSTSSKLESDIFAFSSNLEHGLVFSVTEKFLVTASTTSLFYQYTSQKFEDFDETMTEETYGIINPLSLALGVAIKF